MAGNAGAAERSASESLVVDLRLSHELRFEPRLLLGAPGYVFSDWFRHSQGDPDLWWRLILSRTQASSELMLQLASGAERDGRFRRRPREGCLTALPQGTRHIHHAQGYPSKTDAGATAATDSSQTNYILKTIDEAKIVLQTPQGAVVSEVNFTVKLNNNLAVLGYLETVTPVSVGWAAFRDDVLRAAVHLNEGVLGVATVAFTVEYHHTARRSAA